MAMPMPLCPPIGSSAPSSAACASVVGEPYSSRPTPLVSLAPRARRAICVHAQRRCRRCRRRCGACPGTGTAKGDRVVADGRVSEAGYREERRRALADHAERPGLRGAKGVNAERAEMPACAHCDEYRGRIRLSVSIPNRTACGPATCPIAPSASSTIAAGNNSMVHLGTRIEVVGLQPLHIGGETRHAVRLVTAQLAANENRSSLACVVRRNAAGPEYVRRPLLEYARIVSVLRACRPISRCAGLLRISRTITRRSETVRSRDV